MSPGNSPENAPRDRDSAALPPEFWQGVEQFNGGEFYACHDTLEALWIEALEPEKAFYQGVLQVAVGLYHLSNGNWRGAAIVLGEGIGRLSRYEAAFGGVDVDRLLAESAAVLKALQAVGPEGAIALACGLGLREPDPAAPAPPLPEPPPPLPKIATAPPDASEE